MTATTKTYRVSYSGMTETVPADSVHAAWAAVRVRMGCADSRLVRAFGTPENLAAPAPEHVFEAVPNKGFGRYGRVAVVEAE